ncbi:MAG: hypothetical protein ACJ74A_00835, partial [Gaiellaceae bacterium]
MRLLRDASRLSGLTVRRPVQTATVSANRYGALYARAWSREYPSALRRTDVTVYGRLGLTGRSSKVEPARAWYNISARRLFVQQRPAAQRRILINELVRALIDQNFRLGRVVGLRTRDRDRWLAARGIVNGTAA